MTTKGLEPGGLADLRDVARYWQECLDGVTADNDMLTASRMVGVVSNNHDELWSKNPIYSLIFEIAAALETPRAGDARQRRMQWDCIHALLLVLDQYAE